MKNNVKKDIRKIDAKTLVLTLLPALWFSLALASHFKTLDLHLDHTLDKPSLAHLFGRDYFGRDLLALTLQASLMSTAFALIAVTFTFAFGILGGSTIALSPHTPRTTALRILDFFLSFPSLLLSLAWAAIAGPGYFTLALSLTIGTLPSFMRLMYLRASELLNEDYVTASQSMGASRWHITTHHLFPALFSLARVKLPALTAQALLAEATLSFLGVGAPIGRITWGALLAQGKDYLVEAPHIAIATGFPLFILILCLQLQSERKA